MRTAVLYIYIHSNYDEIIQRKHSAQYRLCSGSVTSLYTNIPHVDGVDDCSIFLREHRVTDNFTDVLCSLISSILTHMYFVFDDHSYLQTSGTAMGTKMAPCYANLFMASIKQTFIVNSPLTPIFHVRFIDDFLHDLGSLK